MPFMKFSDSAFPLTKLCLEGVPFLRYRYNVCVPTQKVDSALCLFCEPVEDFPNIFLPSPRSV